MDRFPQLLDFEEPILRDESGIIHANPVPSGSLADPLYCRRILEVTSAIRGDAMMFKLRQLP